MLRTTKPGLVFLALLAAVVLSVGYILALAILAPEQLAEAQAAATDLICNGCVGTSDIADSAVTSAKIGSGQVATSDLATDSVISSKIGSGQVGNSDIANSAVGTTKISDTNGVRSVDIVNSQVTSADIADGTITSSDIATGAITYYKVASGAVRPNVYIVPGSQKEIAPLSVGEATADCRSGDIVTGGGFIGPGIKVNYNYPYDENTWYVRASNDADYSNYLTAYALCIGLSPP